MLFGALDFFNPTSIKYAFLLTPQRRFFFSRALVAITEKYFTPMYFDHNLTGALADQEVMRDIMRDKLPKLYKHLTDLDIEISTVTLNWFLAVFFDSVPFEVSLK
jgi:hypothetical protein